MNILPSLRATTDTMNESNFDLGRRGKLLMCGVHLKAI